MNDSCEVIVDNMDWFCCSLECFETSHVGISQDDDDKKHSRKCNLKKKKSIVFKIPQFIHLLNNTIEIQEYEGPMNELRKFGVRSRHEVPLG